MVKPVATQDAVTHLRGILEMSERRARTPVAAGWNDDPLLLTPATRHDPAGAAA